MVFFHKNQEQKRFEFKGRRKLKIPLPATLPRTTVGLPTCEVLSEGRWKRERGWRWSNNIPVSELISATMTG